MPLPILRTLLFLFVVADTYGAADSFDTLARDLEKLRNRWDIPGMAAGVSQSNSIVWLREFGYRNLETKEPVQSGTVFHIASLTKPFAAVLLLQLVETGALDLNAPARDFGVNLPADGGVRVIHLLNHTSEGVPGEVYRYSGDRFAALDKVLARASGKTFGELLSEKILEPLHLTNTSPNPLNPVACATAHRDPVAFLQRSAKGYAFDGKTPVEYPKHFVTAAGLVSNCEDLLKFSKALDSDRLLRPETKARGWTPARSSSSKTLPYAVGWFVQSWKGRNLIWHYGWDRANASLILKLPDQQLTFVLLANSEALSRKFDLGRHGDVTRSPFAREFLRTIAVR